MTPAARRRPGAKLVVLDPHVRSTRSANHPRRAHETDPRMERAHRNGSAPPDLLILHNPGSPRFTAEEMTAAADSVLGSRGLHHRLVSIPAGRDGERAVARHVARALREGCLRVAVAGGDGTVSLVAQCVARRKSGGAQVSLGIIPSGTTNVLARELGIPLELDAAMTVIAEADHAVELDAIQVGRRYVFTQVGVGPDALMIRDTPREQQLKLGRWAYMLTFARRALGFRPRWFTLRLDGAVVREQAWQIVAANVGTVGVPPFTWGPRIDPTDGTLDLCVFKMRRKRDLGRLLWRFLTNRHRRDETARFYRVRDRAVIESSHPILVQGDGEIIGRTPVTLRVAPSVLSVLVARPVEGTVPAEPPAVAAQPMKAGETAVAGGEAAEESVGTTVEQMIGERSRTWPLQGRFRHPLAGIEAYDAAIFLKLNSISLGNAADRALELLSRFIHYGEGWAVVVLFLLLVDFKKGLEAAIVALPALWVTMLTVNIVLKRIFRRRRPFISFVKARVIGPRPRDFSFPSGHSAAGFAGAVLLGMFLPHWAPVFYLFALAVAFSRIYLGVHYPSDVLMGGFSGTILAVAFRAILQRLLSGGA